MPSKPHKMLPFLDLLRASLRYNPHSGEFQRFYKSYGEWRALSYRLYIGLCGDRFLAHRIAYYMHHGEDPGEFMVDHINGDRSDNRIVNLRAVTASQNSMNRRTTARSGHKGIYIKPCGTYTVQYCRTMGRGPVGAKKSTDGFYRKTITIGTFKCLRAAKTAYIEWVYNNGLERFSRPEDLTYITD